MTSIATLFIPFVTGVALRGFQLFACRPRRGREGVKFELSWSAVTVMILLVIYETAIATLALAHMTPLNDLSCQLERRWGSLFSNKRADEIRRIQDRHQCCGLYSVRDRAWPFPDKDHTAAACQEAFGRQRSCFGGWRQDEQITGGLILLVAVVAFLLKVCLIFAQKSQIYILHKIANFRVQLLILMIYRNRNPFRLAPSTAFSSFATDEDGDATNVQGRIGTAYHDDLLPETGEQTARSQVHDERNDQETHTGPVVQPSRLQHQNNESVNV